MIKKIRSALDKKQISTMELTNEFLKKIEQTADKNSFITVSKESALAMAQKAQQRIDENSSDILTGIPVSIKDNICTKGIKTTCASKMLEDFIPKYSATAVEKLENQSYILLGKTNMDEFAMGNTSETSYFGPVKNPLDENLIPGGSSGGSAAAVNMNLCIFALGSDTGGSIRQPASFCGIFGLKPTYGKISRHGLISFAPSLDQIGILAKSTEDISIALNTISGEDANDATSINSDACLLQEVKGKIGLPKEFFNFSEDKISKAVEEAALKFEKLGFKIEYCSVPDLKYAVSAYYILSSAEAASNLSRFDGVKYGFSEYGKSFEDIVKNSRTSGFGDEVKRRILLGNYCLREGFYEKYYMKAQAVRNKLKAAYTELFSEYDFLITPTAPALPHEAGKQLTHSERYSSDILTVPANLTGLPCINVPCAKLHNIPVGMSITGKAFSESEILSLSYLFERSFKI